ncbi:interleukin-4-like [Trachemys scripta elegans]|uniref:interleukin-4-like n=1 Tax=Trachemys scripta elegans TaxID=31138 RepID=UPI001557B90C|nr:interleukin-4-like [Trachemys scripta elegans]
MWNASFLELCVALTPTLRGKDTKMGAALSVEKRMAIACNNHVVLGRHRICWVTYLREIIKILDNITKQKDDLTTNIPFFLIQFMASTSLVNIPQGPTCAPLVLKKETFDILCKAATVVENGRCGHSYKFPMEAIYVNLIQLIQKVPCPVKADNNIKLKHFLENLKDFSQRIMKEKYSRIRG